MKKYLSNRFTIDLRNPTIDRGHKIAENYFSNQHLNSEEELNPHFPEPLIDKIETTIIVDLDYRHNLITRNL